MELAIFIAFLAIQFLAKLMPRLAARLSHWVIIQRLSANHWVVWIFHPAVLHSVHEYAIHFVIYSGYVLRAH